MNNATNTDTTNQVAINRLQLLSLKQVLEMDINHGATRAYGITAKQALVNLGLIDSKTRLTKALKVDFLAQVTALWAEAN